MTFSRSGTHLAHTRSLNSESDEVVLIEFDTKGVLVTWPRSQSLFEILNSSDYPSAPEPLIARNQDGWMTFNDGNPQSLSASSVGHTELKFRYRHAIHSGANGIDYSKLNGLASEIEGLAEWAKMWPTTTRVEYGDEQNRPTAVSIRAENLPIKQLSGDLQPQLETSYHHKPKGYEEVASISGALVYKTHSENPIAWQEHENSHQMMADLMTLAYGKPCRFTIDSVWRKDDEMVRDGKTVQQWRDAFAPAERRDGSLIELAPPTTSPLFHLEEVESNKLASWLSSKSPWRRALNIAVSTYFSDNLTSEMKYINVAIALESLGFTIGRELRIPKNKLKKFNTQVLQIAEIVGGTLMQTITKSSTPEQWTIEAGNAYNGLKHANREATDWRVADEKAEEGLTLIRAWAAIELGVDAELVNERLKSH